MVSRVLVVDDNPGDRVLFQRALEAGLSPVEVATAGRLDEALTLLAGRPEVSVTLLDLGLPDARGIDTVAKFVAGAPEVAVIAVTGSDDDELGPRAVAAGAQDFLPKDRVASTDLARVVGYAVERQFVRRELRSANADLEAFAMVVAHDLRSPVATAMGYLDLLEHNVDLPPLGRDLTARLSTAMRSMDDLVSDVLAWTTTSRHEPRVAGVALDDLVTRAASGLPAHAVVVDGILPFVHTDAVLLGQVVTNLVANAVHYGTRAHVTAEVLDTTLRLCVDDEGDGVDPDEREHVFEPFRRGRRAAGTIGTGMGLAIVARAARRLGGRVVVGDAPSGGARFVVEVPVDPAA